MLYVRMLNKVLGGDENTMSLMIKHVLADSPNEEEFPERVE